MSNLWKNEDEYNQWNQQLKVRKKLQESESYKESHGLNDIDFDCIYPDDCDALADPVQWKPGYVWGPAGVGKTRLASQMILWLLNEIRTPVFITARDYVSISRRIDFGRATEPQEAIFENCQKDYYVVIDDLGTRNPSDYTYDSIYGLLDLRSRRGYETLVTSNVDLAGIAQIYDDRIASRIASFGEVRHMTGQDWRLKTP